jgi:hypothetical protein
LYLYIWLLSLSIFPYTFLDIMMENFNDEFYDSVDSSIQIAPLRSRLTLFDDVPGGPSASCPAKATPTGANAPVGPTRFTEPAAPPATPTRSSSLPNTQNPTYNNTPPTQPPNTLATPSTSVNLGSQAYLIPKFSGTDDVTVEEFTEAVSIAASLSNWTEFT